VTTWDKTIMSLQADLLGAHVLGMRTIVAETGRPPPRGDYPNADGIWEVDSVGLIELLTALNQGRDHNGLTLATKTSFHVGARCNPGADDAEAEIARTRAKLRAGARFLVTRPVYELDSLRRMTAALADEDVPVLVAVSPLHGYEEAEYLANEVPDLIVPEATLLAMQRAGANGVRTGLQLASELLRQARPLASGVVIQLQGGDPAADAAALDHLLGAV
jgi:homocysteine S-methyltransferase